MNKRYSTHTLSRCRLAAVAILCAAITAQAWGPAVHLYVADQANKKAGWKNVNEMYGAMAPDVINYMFFSPDLPLMYASTHFDFAALFEATATPAERTLALGFVTHNMAWGADYTAHTGSLTLDPTQGYVIQKAQVLAAMLQQDPVYASLGIPYPITVEICHPMVESSVDLLMRFVDPALGAKMVLAAERRDAAFPTLLAVTYADPFATYFGDSPEAAGEALIQAEAVFRQIVAEQGIAFQQDLPVAIDLLAEQNAAVAAGFLSQYGVVLPPGFDAKGLIMNLIGAGMLLCQDDFATEIQASLEAVQVNLTAHDYRFPQF